MWFTTQQRILFSNRDAFYSKLVYKSILCTVYHALNKPGQSKTIAAELMGFSVKPEVEGFRIFIGNHSFQSPDFCPAGEIGMCGSTIFKQQ